MTKKTEDRGPILERQSAEKHGSGSQSGLYYKVEYRSTSSMTKVIGDATKPFPMVIDHYWRTLDIALGAKQWGINVPIRSWESDACKHGLLSYVAAEAHRWAFLAALEAGEIGGALCVETRLVSVRFSQSYTTQEEGVTAPMALSHRPDSVSPRRETDFGKVEVAA